MSGTIYQTGFFRNIIPSVGDSLSMSGRIHQTGLLNIAPSVGESVSMLGKIGRPCWPSWPSWPGLPGLPGWPSWPGWPGPRAHKPPACAVGGGGGGLRLSHETLWAKRCYRHVGHHNPQTRQPLLLHLQRQLRHRKVVQKDWREGTVQALLVLDLPLGQFHV